MKASRPLLFLLFFLLAYAISPASALEEINQNHVKSFDLQAPQGMSLSGIELFDLDPNSNLSIILNNYGELYTLQINSTKSYYSWWEFNVSLKNPNGTVESKTLKSLAPFAGKYDVHVQYYWQQLNNTIDTSYFDIDVYTGIRPLTALLNANNPTMYQALQFSQITTLSDSYYDLVCYAVTQEEFAKQAGNDALAPITQLTKEFFSWTWDEVLNFVGLIPYIGKYLVSALLISSYLIGLIFSTFNLLFIEYRETTILTFEFFIFAYSINRSKSKNPIQLCRNLVKDHITVYEYVFAAVKFAVDLLTALISMIAHIIQGLKPT